ISSFVEKARALAPVREARQARKGRLIFALDATMSRQPTWDLACSLQAEMFSVVDEIGTLEVQLNYYRGFRECRASKWASSAEALSGFMQQITCRGGRTQISKVLANARKEQTIRPVDALVFIGDAMEENLDLLCDRAGELGLLGVPMFVFQEGRKQSVERAFRELARLTNGAYQRFDDSAASELAALLRAVAVYATGGLGALEAANDRLLLPQLKGRKGR
ncbi:MAG: VWA domain-containing protein, partial [Pseudomonadota bacterium]